MSEQYHLNWLEDLSMEELRRRSYLDGESFEPEVLAEMKAEIVKRYGKELFEADDVILHDVFCVLKADELLEVLVANFSHLGALKNDFMDLLELLQTIDPIPSTIFIALYPGANALSGSGADWHIAGKDPDEEEGIELIYCPWAEWLGFHVQPEHLQLLGLPFYAMICLAHMTKCGMTEEKIAEEFIKVQQSMEEFADDVDDGYEEDE